MRLLKPFIVMEYPPDVRAVFVIRVGGAVRVVIDAIVAAVDPASSNVPSTGDDATGRVPGGRIFGPPRGIGRGAVPAECAGETVTSDAISET
jgi:hypothetical protein